MSAAGMCRPNDDEDEETGTAFVAETPDGNCIVLSALHCFLERDDDDEEEEEEEDVMEVSGVANEEKLVRPRLTSRKGEVKKKSEITLQSENPAELRRIIRPSNDKILRDRILGYCYWFCYKKRKQYVKLRGGDFIAEDVRVEYSVVSVYRTA